MLRLLLVAFLILTGTVSLLPRPALAQDLELPLTPDPADCTADPIDIDRLVEEASANATPNVGPIPEPEEASDDETDRLLGIVVSALACTNANQPLRALSYFTDDYLLSRISDEPVITIGHLQAVSTRSPGVAPVDERVTIEEVLGAYRWPGGGAFELDLVTSSGGQRFEDSLLFRGGRIDSAFRRPLD